MTVHPWPLIETAPGARLAVLWKSGGARGLMIDTPAVPLRFAAELPLEAPAVSASLEVKFDAVRERIRELEALLIQRGLPMTA